MTTQVTPSELAHLRADAEHWFIEDAVLQRTAQTRTNGRVANTWTTEWTGKVRRQPSTETRGVISQGPAGEEATTGSYWFFFFPAGTDVHDTDRILCGGRTYLVEKDLDNSLEIARYVLAREA